MNDEHNHRDGDQGGRRKLAAPNEGPDMFTLEKGEKDRLNKPASESRRPVIGDDEFNSSDNDVDSDEYEFVQKEVKSPQSGRHHDVPQYHFPGTWDAAYHETAKAAKDIKKASTSYYNAIASSGITKAGKSIGGALATTANVGALTVANYAVDTYGTNRNNLPGPINNWLKGKENIDKAKRAAEEAQKARLERKFKEELIARGEVTEVPSRPTSRALRRMDSGDLLEDMPIERWTETNRHRSLIGRRNSARPGLSSKLSNFQIADDDEDEKENREAVTKADKNPWDSSPETPSHTAVFKDLETPGTVRRQLREPLKINMPSRALPFSEQAVESPYSVNDEDRISGFLGSGAPTPTAETAGFRRGSNVGGRRGSAMHGASSSPVHKGVENAGEEQEDGEDGLGMVGLFD